MKGLIERLKARMYPYTCHTTVCATFGMPSSVFSVNGTALAPGQTFTIDPSLPDTDIKDAVDRIEALEACLTELLRLYDWRNDLGQREKAGNFDSVYLVNALRQYGRLKKVAWVRMRELLTC